LRNTHTFELRALRGYGISAQRYDVRFLRLARESRCSRLRKKRGWNEKEK